MTNDEQHSQSESAMPQIYYASIKLAAVECESKRGVITYALRVDESYRDLGHTITLLAAANSITSIGLLSKLYVIGWVTLSDVVANLINHILDLGYDDSDVSLGSILRNRHVCAAGIPEIIRSHSKAVEYERYKRIRNDVAHRWWLEDSQLNKLGSDFLIVQLKMYARSLRRDSGGQAEDDYESNWNELFERMRSIARSKAEELRVHHQATRELLHDLDDLLFVRLNASNRTALSER
jgi:hypothetical protein